MMTRILAAVYSAIDEINAMRPPLEQLPKTPDTPLVGATAQLGSLALVNFIVAVEMGIAQEYDVAVNLSDGRAMSQENSPFRTVGTLADYIAGLLEEKRHGAPNT